MPVELIRLYESGGVTRLGKGGVRTATVQVHHCGGEGGKHRRGRPFQLPSPSPHKHLLAISPQRKTHGTEAAVETFNRSLTKHHFNSCSRSPHCVFFIFIFFVCFLFRFLFFILSFIYFYFILLFFLTVVLFYFSLFFIFLILRGMTICFLSFNIFFCCCFSLFLF